MTNNVSRYLVWFLAIFIQFASLVTLKATDNDEENDNRKASPSVIVSMVFPDPRQQDDMPPVSCLIPDITSSIYKFLTGKSDKDNFSLVCKDWLTLSNNGTKSVIIGKLKYFDNIRNRFPNLEDCILRYVCPSVEKFNKLIVKQELCENPQGTLLYNNLEHAYHHPKGTRVNKVYRVDFNENDNRRPINAKVYYENETNQQLTSLELLFDKENNKTNNIIKDCTIYLASKPGATSVGNLTKSDGGFTTIFLVSNDPENVNIYIHRRLVK